MNGHQLIEFLSFFYTEYVLVGSFGLYNQELPVVCPFSRCLWTYAPSVYAHEILGQYPMFSK